MEKQVETAEITVAYVNPPKPGKKWGNLKSASGDLYWGPPSMLAHYSQGETCRIEFELGGNDGTLRSLRRKLSTTPAALVTPTPLPARARTNPVDQEQMFVVALLKEMVKPEDTAATLIAKTNTCRQAWRNTFGGSETQRNDDMNDEIPEFR